ncbi:hydroxyproline-rich glycoprotein family protein [Tanacetum coccineum]
MFGIYGVINGLADYQKKKCNLGYIVTAIMIAFGGVMNSVFLLLWGMYVSEQLMERKRKRVKALLWALFGCTVSVPVALEWIATLKHLCGEMVDEERKQAMGYIYKAMDNGKDAIRNSFPNKMDLYKKTIEIIDHRWECQLHRPLHAAGYYLNPSTFYDNPIFAPNTKVEEGEAVRDGLLSFIQRLSATTDFEDQVLAELPIYESASGLFGKPSATRQRTQMTPVLQAVKGTGRYFNTNEEHRIIYFQLHTKKRNRLAQSRLNDMVFVKFNRALERRSRREGNADPILLNEIDDSNEWMMGRMEDDCNDGDDLVYIGEDLTWGDVERASGANDPSYSTRASRQSGVGSSRVDKGKGQTPVRKSRPFELVDEDDFEEDIEASNDDNGAPVAIFDGDDDDLDDY